jgi:predicted O-methyltransferase YrrM
METVADYNTGPPLRDRDLTRRVDSVVNDLFAAGDPAFLSSAVSREEGGLLRVLASRPEIRKSIEIGCANAISTLYICSGTAGKANPSHTAIDPFQTAAFARRGVRNVERAGIDFFELIEKPSEIALPELLADGRSYDFALIDGLHTADQTMVDFYYLDRMLRVGGILVFDDANAAAVNKIVRYASTYPNYRLIAASGRRGPLRQAINAVKHGLSLATWPLRRLLKDDAFREIFDVSLVDPGLLWSVDYHSMIAFEKTGEFERDTNWYRGL